MKQDEIRRVLIIGAGLMGQQIGWQCAAHGCDVVLYDVAAPALENALRQLDEYAAELNAQGFLTTDQCETARRRITTTTDPRFYSYPNPAFQRPDFIRSNQ